MDGVAGREPEKTAPVPIREESGDKPNLLGETSDMSRHVLWAYVHNSPHEIDSVRRVSTRSGSVIPHCAYSKLSVLHGALAVP